jgi:hypothetical protein
VRGVVAALLDHPYAGIDLRPEQVAANEEQWAAIGARGEHPPPRWILGDGCDLDTLASGPCDIVFSCPPYHDLEQYSDDPRDLSNMEWEGFAGAYRTIITKAVAALRPNRFAVFVVGDVRGPDGCYRNLPGLTIAAFEAAGARLYNEAILVTAVGSLPIRAGRQFAIARKLGKTHQNVLVFVKSDPRKAADACGPVDVTMPADLEAAPDPSSESP